MPYPATAVGQVALVTFRASYMGQLILSTFKYRITTVGTDPTFDAAAENLHTDLVKANGLMPKFLTCCCQNYTLVESWIQLIFPTRYRKQVFPENKPGLRVELGTTGNLAAVISRMGVVAKRTNQGSLHIPYSNADPQMSGGFISQNMSQNMSTLGSEMLNVRVPAQGLTVWEPGLLPAKATTIQQWVPLYTTTPQQTVRTMHRRTVGLGK